MSILKTTAVLAIFLFPACGDAGSEGSVLDKVGKVAKQADVMGKLKGTLSSLQATLTGVTDGTTAQAAKGKLDGLIGPLKSQLGDLGGLSKLGSLKDGAIKGVMGQVTRLLGNADINSVLGPILQKLKGALNG